MSIFKTKPKYHFFFGNENVGGFNVDLYVDEKNAEGNYLEITTTSGIFSMRISDYTFGYLLTAAMQGKTEELHSFAAMQYYIASGVYSDAGLAQDVVKAVLKHQKRRFVAGESEAKAVTPEQNEADAALMSEIASYADATPKKRKKMRKQWKEEAKKALKEDKV